MLTLLWSDGGVEAAIGHGLETTVTENMVGCGGAVERRRDVASGEEQRVPAGTLAALHCGRRYGPTLMETTIKLRTSYTVSGIFLTSQGLPGRCTIQLVRAMSDHKKESLATEL